MAEKLLKGLKETDQNHALAYQFACLLTPAKPYETKMFPSPSYMIQKDNQSEIYEKDSFEFEICNLMENYPGIENIVLSSFENKVQNVSCNKFPFEDNILLTNTEKKLGFKEIIDREIPKDLNFLRIITLLIENILEDFINDDYFYFNQWTTQMNNSRIEYYFALNTVRQLRESAIIVSELYLPQIIYDDDDRDIDVDDQNGTLQKMNPSFKSINSIFVKCENDINADKMINKKERKRRKVCQFSEEIQRYITKFIITLFLLNKVINVIKRKAYKVTVMEDDVNRIKTLQAHLSNLLYKIYCDYFSIMMITKRKN